MYKKFDQDGSSQGSVPPLYIGRESYPTLAIMVVLGILESAVNMLGLLYVECSSSNCAFQGVLH
jgi:hypothetical protein